MNIDAIVLAAGFSKRMGDTNKLTLEVNGKPILRHTLDTLISSNIQRIYVVVGHESSEIVALANKLDVEIVFNPDFADGQMTSVHAGLQSVPDSTGAVMVCLSDQVLLEVEDINYLIEQFGVSDQRKIFIPTFDDKRGNPIIIPRQIVKDITSQSKNLGCRNLVRNHPDITQTCAMSNDHVLIDIDTPDDYQKIKKRCELYSRSESRGDY